MIRRKVVNHWGMVAYIVIVLALVGCGSEPDSASQQNLDEQQLQEEAVVQPTVEPTEVPFKETLALCGLNPPDVLLTDRGPTADAVRSMTMLQPVIFGEDYVAEVDDQYTYLVALPSVGDDTLRRNDFGQTVVTLRYRSDLVWSDGEIFDAADAALGFILPPPPDKPTFETVSVTQVDQFTLQVVAAPGAEYPYVPFHVPAPEHVFGPEAYPETILNSAFATSLTPSLGLYTAQLEADSISLTQNPIFTGVVGLPSVIVRTVSDSTTLANEVASTNCDAAIDGYLTLEQYTPLQSNPALSSVAYNSPVREQLFLNTHTPSVTGRVPYFADVRVRQAVAFAIDIEAIAAARTNFSPLTTWIVPEHWAAAPQAAPTYAPDQAQALLAEAGWSDTDGDGVLQYGGVGGEYNCQRGRWLVEEDTSFSVSLIYPSGDVARQTVAETIVSQLADIGIEVVARPVDPADMFDQAGPLAQRQFDLALLAGVNRPDPDGIALWVGSEVFVNPPDGALVHRWELEDRYIETLQLAEIAAINNIPSFANDFSGQNFSGWCNEAANLAVTEANRALNFDQRAVAYAQQQQIFAEERPVIPLYARPEFVVSQAYVCGITPNPFDPVTWHIGAWYFDETGACDASP